MKQLLENNLYDVRPVEARPIVYQVGDLESLSASALYYGAVGSGGGTLRPIGKIGKFGMVKTPLMKNSVPVLKIRPLPTLGADLHIHQHGGFISGAKIKPYGDDKGIKLTNYKASMSDLYADLLKKKILIFPDKK